MARRRDSKGRFIKRHHTAKYRTTRIMRRTTRTVRRKSRSSYAKYHPSNSALGGKSYTKPLLMVLGVAGAFLVWQKMKGGTDAATAAATAQMNADAASYAVKTA